MTLNLKNVKGYDRLPYCQVHYPQPKPTAIVDNPEMQRMRLLTDIQSTAKYHEDFNKSKGKFTAVADDPVSNRAKEHQRMISQAEYTGKRKENTSQLPQQVAMMVDLQPKNGSEPKLTSTGSRVGRVADYDPINDHHGSLAHGYEPTSKAMHKFDATESHLKRPDQNSGNGNRNAPSHESSDHSEHPTMNSHEDRRSSLMKVRALYSYVASESDEISFDEGDTIIECEQIDAGWMLGRHSMTGKQGLLPSNYVEIVQ